MATTILCLGLCLVSLSGSVIASENAETIISDKGSRTVIAEQNVSVEEVVRKYLELDARGAQLTYAGQLKLSALTVSPPDTEHATYTTKVISGYRIISSAIIGNRAHVVVEFDYVGTMVDDFLAFRPGRKKSRLTIELTKTAEGSWKVNADVIPHIDWRIIVTHKSVI